MTEEARNETLDSISQATFEEFMAQQARDFGAGEEIQLEEDGEEEDLDATKSPSHREGTDVVLARLRESDPEAFRLLRSMQQTMSKNINETGTLQQQLIDTLEQVLERRNVRGETSGEAAGESEPAALPDGVTADNVRLFKQVADHLGYVPREELETRDKERVSGGYVRDALLEGVELFGEDFGSVDDDGNVTVDPGVSGRLAKHLARLQDGSRGITPLDLFLIEKGRQALAAAQKAADQRGDNGLGAGSTRSSRPRRPVTGAQVARRGAGSRYPVQIYDPKRGDSSDDVLDRAWALAKRSVTNR